MFGAVHRPMKVCPDLDRRCGRSPNVMLILLAAVLTGGAGCGKAGTPAPPVTASQNPVAAPAPVTPSPTASPRPTTTTAPNNSGPNSLQLLNRALMRWMIQNRRHPRSFEEFAGSTEYKIPAPPAGKKYALNSRGFIILVDNSTQ